MTHPNDWTFSEALIRGDLNEEKGVVKEWFREKVVQEIEAGQAKGKRLL